MNIPHDESARLAALRQRMILDTPPEPAFDALTRLAAHICGTPIAIMTLVDADRQWFKSQVGLDVPETPRDIAFCAQAIQQEGLFIVSDALFDERFATNPLVTAEPHIRFYAGMPFSTSEGHALGTLCVIDHVPRELSPCQLEALRTLALEVATHLELRRNNRELKEARDHLRIILDAAGEGIYGVDAAGHTSFVNPAAARMLGWEPHDLLGKPMHDVTHHSHTNDSPHPEEQCPIHATLKGKEVHEVDDEVFWRKDGTSFPVKYISTPLFREGKLSGAVTVLQDITERKQADQRLRDSEERYRSLYEYNPTIYFTFDAKGTILSVNQFGAEQLGYKVEELVGQSGLKVVHEDDRLAVKRHFAACIKNLMRVTRWEFRKVRKDGSVIWVKEFVRPMRRDDGSIVVLIVCEDTTERKQLNYLANHDALTGLPNRTLFHDRLMQALARAYRQDKLVAVLFIDLDRFKRINDTLGHSIGDLLLGVVAQRLETCVREGDSVARLGGDEFALILESIVQASDVTRITKKVLDSLFKSFELEGHELFITTSIGISLYPVDGRDPQTLLKNADTAMYLAKEQGRNHYRYYSRTMGAKASKRLALENGLRHALEREEFVLHYQPQVDLESGRIIAVEALLRWRHPESGKLILPARFVPIAEETGLIVPIGAWVLRTACAQNKAWQSLGLPPIRVAVNLSARQFYQQNVKEIIAQALNETGLDPNCLELELTESILQTEETAVMLRILNRTGIQIAIDDFGTGYSSLSYLKRFPIYKLKIDRSFMHHVPQDRDNAAITTAIISIAHDLSLKVIAEGVETIEQQVLLRSLHCDEIQGYLYSRPLCSEEATKLLSKNESLAAVELH